MQFVKESKIAASVERVFQFHEAPEALSLLIPPWEKVRIISSAGSLAVGSKVVLENRLGPLRLRWIALHTEYEPPHLFADRQESGPFAYWYHRHHFLSDGTEASILRDEVEYRLPGGWLGRLVAGHYVRSKLEKMFAYRHEITRKILEESVAEPK